MKLLLLALGLALCTPADAQIYRCKEADGRITYQDKGCATGEQQRATAPATAPLQRPAPPDRHDPAWRMAVRQAIGSGTPLVGMNRAELLQAIGKPESEAHGQLVYQRAGRRLVVKVEEGFVTALQTAPGGAQGYSAAQAPAVASLNSDCPSEAEIRRLQIALDNPYNKDRGTVAGQRERLRAAQACVGKQ